MNRYGNQFGSQPEPSIWDSLLSSAPLVVGLVILLLWLSTTIVITRGMRAKIVEILGQPEKKARLSGLSFKLPFPFARVVGNVNLQLCEIGSDVKAKTKDNAFLTLPVKVQYRATRTAEGALLAHYELDDPESQIVNYVLNNVSSTVPKMDMETLFQQREQIETEVLGSLQEKFGKSGYSIENVLVDEPDPSEEVKKSFNDVIASKRAKEAAQNIADAEKIRLVGIAKAEKESKKLQGEGLADMRKAIATGMDVSMETLMKSGISKTEALVLLMHTNHLDTLGSAAAGGNMIITDMGAGALGTDDIFAATAAAMKATRQDGGASSSSDTET